LITCWEPTDNEATMLGTLRIYGVNHHVTAIQVTDDDEGYQTAVNDPYGRLDDAYAADADGIFQTVEIPGYPGEWVLHITPYKD
jgi:hypothetical protein